MDKVKKLPKDIEVIWRLNALLDCTILLAITLIIFIGKTFVSKGMQPFLLIVGLAFLGLTILIPLIEVMLVNYHWNYWTYYIDAQQVELRHGFFFRKQIIIPIARIQNVTLKQGPILRLKNLQKIVIETAAGGNDISGIKNDEADNLKELIMKLAREAQNDL
ncbi:PH domain-containing protein [Companilactobacillus crustorum]|uniref:PH domain-containing protein n=1 Tax=Companilactobacillus crustorum TaxID=392416 RepID=UPI00237DAF97|nr:PH domain-containing protein [Companilactobacillus crustorum]WDT66624.1 PH domain-containing protein [Companilactobacillus crustorum]